MNEQPVHLTPEGLAKLKAELDELIGSKRPYITERIKQARELGDLSENFEYHAAKNEQGLLESRIRTIETMLRNAQIITGPSGDQDTVELGCTVTFKDEEGVIESYAIVGTAEADPGAGKISHESPIGKALLGLRRGESVEIEIPAGIQRLTILEVS